STLPPSADTTPSPVTATARVTRYRARSLRMSWTSALTDAKACRPTSSSGIETWNFSSTRTTSSRASMESRPSPSPKIGESSGMSDGASSSRRPVARSSFTSVLRAPASIPPCLEHREAAVHVERRPREVARVLRGEEQHRRRDLLGTAEAAERHLALDVLPRRLRHVRHELRRDEARRDGVHGDGEACDLAGERLRQRHEAALRGGVVGCAFLAEERGR